MAVFLLHVGANIQLKDMEQDSVLHFACMKSVPHGTHEAILELLLETTEAKGMIDVRNAKGDTPLMLAARCGFPSRARLLLKYGADPLISNLRNELPFHRACTSMENLEVSYHGNGVVCSLVSGSFPPQLVLRLAEVMPDINVQDADGWTPLMFACKAQCNITIQYLLQRGADPNIPQVGVVHDGVQGAGVPPPSSYPPLSPFLLPPSLSPTPSSHPHSVPLPPPTLPLSPSLSPLPLFPPPSLPPPSYPPSLPPSYPPSLPPSSHPPSLPPSSYPPSLPPSHPPSLPPSSYPPSLPPSSYPPSLPPSSYPPSLLPPSSYPPSLLPSLQSAGFTALYLAAQENSPTICELLLEKGAKCNVQGGLQQLTPLHLAAHAGYMAVSCVLAEHGANPHLKDSDGDSPLQLCSAELKSAILGAWSCSRWLMPEVA